MKRKLIAGSSKSLTWPRDEAMCEGTARVGMTACEWLRVNREAIAAYNERILRRGVFSDGVRRF